MKFDIEGGIGIVFGAVCCAIVIYVVLYLPGEYFPQRQIEGATAATLAQWEAGEHQP